MKIVSGSFNKFYDDKVRTLIVLKTIERNGE